MVQIENGVDGLIIGGTTGEGQLMSWDEHVMLIAHTVNRCATAGQGLGPIVAAYPKGISSRHKFSHCIRTSRHNMKPDLCLAALHIPS